MCFTEHKVDEIAPPKKRAVAAFCNECGKTFTKYSNLTQHVRKFHPGKLNAFILIITLQLLQTANLGMIFN